MLEEIEHEVKITMTDDMRRLWEELAPELPSGFMPEFLPMEGAGHQVDVTASTIRYTSVTAAARGIGACLAGLEGREELAFDTLCLMLDISRNGVPTVSYGKSLLRRLALLGYNQVMLYAEDNYVLEGEPAFGAWRGPLTAQEVRELDQCAWNLGIELVPCIQTLGHLEQFLKWDNTYRDYADTRTVLQVGKDKVYQLIGQMLDFWSRNVRSRRIHVGLDETHGLGSGLYYAKHGNVPRMDIFVDHLNQVAGLCRQRGLKPMYWGDMYMRYGSVTGETGDLNSKIPEEVLRNIPMDAQLVYWDYYQTDEASYRGFIDLYRRFGFEPIFAGSLYSSNTFWCDETMAESTLIPAVGACRKASIKEFMVTAWNDDGACACWESMWPGLAGTAELAWGGTDYRGNAVRERTKSNCHVDYERSLTASRLNVKMDNGKGDSIASRNELLLWDDPLLGMATWCYEAVIPQFVSKAVAYFSQLADDLADRQDHPWLLAETLRAKLALMQELDEAYARRDMETLRKLKDVDIPDLIDLNERLTESFRKDWLSSRQAFGLETIQIRQAGQIARLQETARRIGELLEGTVHVIEELEQRPSPFAGYPYRYAYTATGGII